MILIRYQVKLNTPSHSNGNASLIVLTGSRCAYHLPPGMRRLRIRISIYNHKGAGFDEISKMEDRRWTSHELSLEPSCRSVISCFRKRVGGMYLPRTVMSRMFVSVVYINGHFSPLKESLHFTNQPRLSLKACSDICTTPFDEFLIELTF